MAINQLLNTASVVFNGEDVDSNTVTTNLLLAPVLTKSVDKSTAYIGDTLTYTVVIKNESLVDILEIPFTDALPDGSEFVDGSFTEGGVPSTPYVADSILSHTIGTVPAGGSVTISYKVTVVG